MTDRARQIERLVDGEMSSDEYRSLLATLEEEPGGWRQCALAFLETQALGKELSDVHRCLDRTEKRHTNREVARRASPGWDNARLLLAVAASFLVAFGLGVAAPKIFSWWQESAVAGNLYVQSPANMTDGRDSEEVPHDVMRYVGDVRLLVDGSAESAQEAGRVPVYDVGQDVTRFLANEAPALGPEMLNLLRQSGYDVRHDQQYFPAPLDDGRQIIVPVEGYQITPVSRRY